MESHDYYARINGKDYPIVWGFQIMEEMGETLDMGSITLPHVFEIISLKPYDDVIIHDYAPNASPEEGGLPNRPLGKIFTPEKGHFYKHMVVSSYTREKVNLADEREKTNDEGKKYFSRVYNYSIQLKSETCKLETVQLPNRTITQPMSLADGETSKTLSANFKFGGDTKKYTLPYGEENSSSGKSFHLIEEVKENQSALNIDDWRILHAYVGDDNHATSDYSSFLPMTATASPGEVIVLPDWAISGVSTVQEDFRKGLIGKYFDSWGSVSFHHPKKHWIVRKLNGKSNKGWESRSVVVERIKKYLSGFDDDEIINSSLTDAGGASVGRDISSSDSISTKRIVLPSSDASYIIYLYCDPEIVSVKSLEDDTDVKANLYGMTDNSNGTTRPAETDEFLCSWGTESEPFAVSSVTPLSKGALSVYEAIRQAVELYSPYLKSKENADSDKWTYRRKFSIGDDVKAIFSSVAAPENQWNCPNLRDLLTRLMYVKDCIPVIHDNVINCMNLSKRGVIPFDDSKGLFGIENYAMDGNSYCDRLIRTYNDGLSKDNVVKCTQRVGFRNSDSATLTLDSLRLELTHPIYRITKLYMCHYNKMSVNGDAYYGVIKHDITPLIILNSQRNLLSEDWASLNAERPKSLNELAKYKYATIGYDIGSRYISGWGAKYTYPSCAFWSGSKTVIENIFNFASSLNPHGATAFSIFSELKKIAGDDGTYDARSSEFVTGADSERDALHSKNVTQSGSAEDDDKEWSEETASETFRVHLGTDDGITYGGIFTNVTEKLKSLFFIVEYEGYVSASVVASKDFHDGDVVSRDNASSSLSFVESDGANQKEKVNRLGNAIVSQPVRYSNREDIEELAQVWDGYSLSDEEREQSEDVNTSKRMKEHDDEVLYQRKMIFERDFVQASYTFCRNYVLRNYFTSVFAKRRPFALASYEESVERQENKTIQLRFSPDSVYYQPSSMSKVANYCEDYLIPMTLSFYKATEYDEDGNKVISNGIDSCYYMVFPSKNFSYDGQCGVFASDCQKFTSGNSMCFSVTMADNVSAGVFVSDWNPTLGAYIGNLMMSRFNSLKGWMHGYRLSEDDVRATNLLTGSKQDWLMLPVDPDTGELYSIRFGVGMKTNDFYAVDSPSSLNPYDLASYQMFPLLDAAIISPDAKTVTYFGEDGYVLSVHSARGLGTPRLMFERNASKYADNETAYNVDFSNVGKYYGYDKLVHVWSIADYSGIIFVDADGNTTTERQTIKEIMSAKFVGRETETSDETDTCVFKDGKERISVTLQVEPISEDNRILFSDRMMKLSDAIGGYEKNYSATIVGNKIKVIAGIIDRQFYWLNQYNTSITRRSISASIPSVAIFIPESAEPAVAKAGIDVNATYSWSNTASYSIAIKKINGFDAIGRLVVSCEISCSASNSVISENVIFEKVDSSSMYIKGRTGKSTFNTNYVLFSPYSQSGYSAYVMVDDGFLATANNDILIFNDETQDNETYAGAASGHLDDFGAGSLARISNSTAFPEYPLSVGSLSYGTNTGASFQSIVSTTSSVSSIIYTPYACSFSSKSPVDVAEIDASEISKLTKKRNMFWAKAPIMGSREASWDVRTSLEDSEFDIIDGIFAETEEIYPREAKVTVRRKAKTALFYSSTITVPKDVVPDGYELVSFSSVALSSYTSSTSEVGAVLLSDLGDGKFQLVCQPATPGMATIDQTATISATLSVKVKVKKLIPVSTEQDSRGLWRLKIALDEPLIGDRSLRLYYKEGREYHFVFGANLGAKADKGKSDDVIYPSDDADNVYYIYVSVLDDRSKTVIDAETGDPTYKVVNWLDDERKDAKPYNACVKKG